MVAKNGNISQRFSDYLPRNTFYLSLYHDFRFELSDSAEHIKSIVEYIGMHDNLIFTTLYYAALTDNGIPRLVILFSVWSETLNS